MRVVFGEYQLDTETRTLQREGRRIAVQSKAFDLLAYLIERRERVVSSDELLDALWPGLHVTPAALSTAVQKVRQAVGDDGAHQVVLHTEHGKGFRFVAEVTDLSPAETDLLAAESAQPSPARSGSESAGAAPMSLVAELKRRNVFRVAAAYGIVAWLLVEVASVVLPTFEAPDWVMKVLTFLVILGFPLALILAWAFELTPEGIKLEKTVDRARSITQQTGQKLNFAIIGLLGIAVIFMFVDNYVLEAEPEQGEVAAEQVSAAEPVMREQSIAVLSILPPEGATVAAVAISPDGKQLVFIAEEPSGSSYLWLRPLDSQVPQRLPGTSGAIYPFWSPDGRYVGFFADGKLKKMEVPGGPVEELADAPGLPRGGTWNREGTIVFAMSGGGLHRVAASGGRPVRVTSLNRQSGEDSHRYPSFLPDGRHVLYFARNPVNRELTGVWVASLEGETSQLLSVNSLAMYAPPGYLLYRRGGNLLAHPFDARTLSFTREPVSVADDIGYDPAFSGLVIFSVSETGLLAYEGGGIKKSELLWFDRSGNVIGSVGTPANYLNFYLSPDDSKLAVSRTDERAETRDLWLYDLGSARESQFTFNGASDFSPLWSPDATEIIFTSSRTGTHDIYSQAAAGGAEAELLWEMDSGVLVRDWSADGRFVVFEPDVGVVDLWILDLETTQAAPFRETQYHEYFGTLSPDMHWIAYSSNATGAFEVWVERFPVSGEPWLVSSGGGFQPIWHPDGSELFYISPDAKLMAVKIVRSDTTFETAAPRELFQARISMATVNPPDSLNHYDVDADGQRFLIASQPEATRAIVVIANWAAALRQ